MNEKATFQMYPDLNRCEADGVSRTVLFVLLQYSPMAISAKTVISQRQTVEAGLLINNFTGEAETDANTLLMESAIECLSLASRESTVSRRHSMLKWRLHCVVLITDLFKACEYEGSNG